MWLMNERADIHYKTETSGLRSNGITIITSHNPMEIEHELTKGTREAVAAGIKMAHLRSSNYLFQSRIGSSKHISTRQYHRIIHGWIEKLGFN